MPIYYQPFTEISPFRIVIFMSIVLKLIALIVKSPVDFNIVPYLSLNHQTYHLQKKVHIRLCKKSLLLLSPNFHCPEFLLIVFNIQPQSILVSILEISITYSNFVLFHHLLLVIIVLFHPIYLSSFLSSFRYYTVV